MSSTYESKWSLIASESEYMQYTNDLPYPTDNDINFLMAMSHHPDPYSVRLALYTIAYVFEEHLEVNDYPELWGCLTQGLKHPVDSVRSAATMAIYQSGKPGIVEIKEALKIETGVVPRETMLHVINALSRR
jgi:hypothetical protein